MEKNYVHQEGIYQSRLAIRWVAAITSYLRWINGRFGRTSLPSCLLFDRMYELSKPSDMNQLYTLPRSRSIQPHAVWVVCALLGLLASFSAQAQVTVSLDISEKNGLTTVPAGKFITVKLNYSISSTTGNANGVKAVLNLPDDVADATNFVGTNLAPASNFVFDNTFGAKKVTINFVDPVPSGSTGVLEIGVQLTNSTIRNNTTETFTAVLTDGSGNTSGTKTLPITVTATPSLCVSKVFDGGGAVDGITTYRILARGTNDQFKNVGNGYIAAQNISISDQLPTGAVFVSATVFDPFGSALASPTPDASGVLSFTLPSPTTFRGSDGSWEVPPPFAVIKVKYPSPAFKAGDQVTNTITGTYNFPGEATKSLVDGQTIGLCASVLGQTTTLQAATPTATLSKSFPYGSGTQYYPGQVIRYQINYANTGNVDLADYEIVETIPSVLKLTIVALTDGLKGFYKTDQNSTYKPVVVDGYGNFDQTILVGGEKVTKVKLTYSPNGGALPASFVGSQYNNSLGFQAVTEVTQTTPFTNCIEWNSTSPGIAAVADRRSCVDATLEPRKTTVTAYLDARLDQCNGLRSLGDKIQQNIAFGPLTDGADLVNPVIMDLLPVGHTFVPGSVVFSAPANSTMPPPTPEILPNYGGTGRTLVRFTWPAGTVMKSNIDFPNFALSFKFQVSAGAQAGNGVAPDVYAYADNKTSCSGYPNPSSVADVNDLNGNGNTSDILCTVDKFCGGYTVGASASMESIKWVKGQCDTKYGRYPGVGATLPGGSADYRLVVKNTGTVPMTQVKIIDILPFVGDRGVIDPSARATQWRPNLAAPLTPPSGVTVYYSTVQNPCRDEVKAASDPSPFPAGCTPPSWSTSPPSDITKVQSLKLDFGSLVIQSGDSLITTWPMRAPVDAPTNGEIAWNSFAFLATRTDNNQALLAAEPIKVGIKVKVPTPGIWGDFVWLDNNKDGIQDAGEPGVPGVTVTLYSASGSTPNPATDSQIGYTITDGNGKYLFTNLQPGNYYAVFTVPPGYTTSPNTRPTNNANGSEGPISGIYPIAAGQDDRTHDLGIYLSPDCSVKITNATVSPCLYDPIAKVSRATINVFVQWANAPAGQTISVKLDGGNTQTINVSTTTSPALVSFTVLSDGSSHTLDASFNATCKDTKSVDAPLPCAPGVCAVDITDVRFGACDVANANRTATVKLAWSNVPVGEDIDLYYNGVKVGTVLTSGGITSPSDVMVTLPATGVAHDLLAQLTKTSSCSTTQPATVPVCLVPCAFTTTVSQPVCNSATNQYTLTGTISLSNTAGGTATISDGAISTTVTVAASATAVAYSLTGLVSGTGSHTVTVSLAGCGTASTTYSAPASCTVAAPACALSVTATPGACTPATNQYVLTVTLAATANTGSKSVEVNTGQGLQTVILTGNGPTSFTVGPTFSNGLSYTLTATTPGCSSATTTYTAPSDCLPKYCADQTLIDNFNDAGTSNLIFLSSIGSTTTSVASTTNAIGGTRTVTVGPLQDLSGIGSTNAQAYVTQGQFSVGMAVGAKAPVCVSYQNVNLNLKTTDKLYTRFTFFDKANGTNLPVTITLSDGTSTATVSNTMTTQINPAGDVGIDFSLSTLTGTVDLAAIQSLTVCFDSQREQDYIVTEIGLCKGTPLPCALTTTINQPVCNSLTNQYTLTGSISLTNNTAGGTATITDGAISTTVTVAASATAVAYSLSGLTSGSGSHTVTVSLPGCGSATAIYTAPASCSVGLPTYALAKSVDLKQVEKGGIVTYTLSLTNTSGTTATGLVLTDQLSTTAITLVGSATTSAGTFIPGLNSGTWSIPSLGGGQVATLVFRVQLNEEGITYNTVTLPGQQTATVCVSVPAHVCANESFQFELTAPASYSTYQWTKNGTIIPGATSATYSVTAVGEYSVQATTTGGCPDGSCCPFVVVADPVPSLTALAVSAQCVGQTPLPNAAITLVGSSTNAVSYNITKGSSFTASAPLFGSPQNLSAVVGGVLIGGQPNPALAQDYTIRVYSANGCYADTVVTIQPVVCVCPPAACAPFVVKKTKSQGKPVAP